jgi:hypothetical protein
MKSEKIFEFSENTTRGYFTFVRSGKKMVISLPKDNSPDRSVYVGQSIENMKEISIIEAKNLMEFGIQLTIARHPRFRKAVAQLGI